MAEANFDLAAVEQRFQQGNIPVYRLQVKENQIFSLTAAELRACCAKNPTHPHATIFLNAVRGCPANHECHVDRVDLEALLTNKEVKLDRTQTQELVDGEQVLVTTEAKTLVEKGTVKNEET